jgi:hypothetical protein
MDDGVDGFLFSFCSLHAHHHHRRLIVITVLQERQKMKKIIIIITMRKESLNGTIVELVEVKETLDVLEWTHQRFNISSKSMSAVLVCV